MKNEKISKQLHRVMKFEKPLITHNIQFNTQDTGPEVPSFHSKLLHNSHSAHPPTLPLSDDVINCESEDLNCVL